MPKPTTTLHEMRSKLRAGMSREEFFAALDAIVEERGLCFGLPTADERVIAVPVKEGGELLCFLPHGRLEYVEYRGGIFLAVEEDPSG
jgi:hypothetical protein